ncbi:MAG: cell division protein ZapA [Halanaerobiales bacterium]|nr:cell division protein ZapA [Halanaerobiales bacterium]
MVIEDKYKPEKRNKFSIKILGEELIIVGDISDKYVKALTSHINRIGKDLNQAYPHLPRQRLLGLTMVNIADGYFKLNDDYIQQQKDLEMLKRENQKMREEYYKLQGDYKELLELLEGDD